MSCADPAPQNSIAIHSLSLLETQKGSFHNIALHNLIVHNFTKILSNLKKLLIGSLTHSYHFARLNIRSEKLLYPENVFGPSKFNPLTPRCDQHETFPCNIHTLFSKKIMTIFKLIR